MTQWSDHEPGGYGSMGLRSLCHLLLGAVDGKGDGGISLLSYKETPDGVLPKP